MCYRCSEPAPGPIQKPNRVLIVGAGTMGTQIAVQCAGRGRFVLLYDSALAALELASGRLEQLALDLASKGLLGASNPPDALARIQPCTDIAVAKHAAIVIECVPENLELKKSVFEQLGHHCPPETIYATNTSSIADFISTLIPRTPHPAF